FFLVVLPVAFLVFPALHLHRFFAVRRLLLFFASTTTFPENDSFPDRLHHKSFVVLRSGLGKDFINGAPRRDALQQFLQITLGIDIDRFFRQLGQILVGLG